MESKKTLAEILTQKKDKYDPETVSGCLNRIRRIVEKDQKMSDKYNLDPQADLLAWKFWQLQSANFWDANEFDYTTLSKDYDTASPSVRRAVDLINGWFAGGDGLIVKNTGFRFAVEADTMSRVGAYLTQIRQEFVHAETYIKCIIAMNNDPIHREEVLRYADTLPCVRNKEMLMEQYMEADLPFGYRILAFACAEGIGFWSAFDFVFWLRSRGIFRVLAEINEKVSVDESLHRDFACAIFRSLPLSQKPSFEHVIQIVKEFVDAEIDFTKEFTSGLANEGYDYTPEGAKKFVHFMANSLLIGLGYEAHFEDAEFPEYIRSIVSSQKGNFYEVNIGAYPHFELNKIVKEMTYNSDDDSNADGSESEDI